VAVPGIDEFGSVESEHWRVTLGGHDIDGAKISTSKIV
jgi:hypothetical protein